MSITGSDDSDSDITTDVEMNNISTEADGTKNTTSPTSLNTDVKYNSVYHNAGTYTCVHSVR